MELLNLLLEEKNICKLRIRKIDQLIETYEKPSITSTVEVYKEVVNDSYPVDKGIMEQVNYIIHREQRFLRIKEIANYIMEKVNNADLKKLKSQISNSLSRLKRETNVIVSYHYSNNNIDTVWGHKEWLDNKGIPQEKHL